MLHTFSVRASSAAEDDDLLSDNHHHNDMKRVRVIATTNAKFTRLPKTTPHHRIHLSIGMLLRR